MAKRRKKKNGRAQCYWAGHAVHAIETALDEAFRLAETGKLSEAGGRLVDAAQDAMRFRDRGIVKGKTFREFDMLLNHTADQLEGGRVPRYPENLIGQINASKEFRDFRLTIGRHCNVRP